MKILLNNKRSRLSTNKDTFLSVGLENQMKKVSNKNDEHLVDVYQVYLDEKDASDKYRLIFTINPVCTNALFNAITEIVYKEGSPDCERLLSFTGGTAPDKVKYPNIISD
jgi:lantibiotic modifying enzyme